MAGMGFYYDVTAGALARAERLVVGLLPQQVKEHNSLLLNSRGHCCARTHALDDTTAVIEDTVVLEHTR